MKRKRLSSKSKASLISKAWKVTPKDYRSTFNGKRSVLVMGPHGTTIKALDSFTEEELQRYIR